MILTPFELVLAFLSLIVSLILIVYIPWVLWL